MDLFQIIGAVGLILISVGIVIKRRIIQDILYICGGLCLEAYSIYLGNVIFIILQLVFTIAAVWDLIKIRLRK